MTDSNRANSSVHRSVNHSGQGPGIPGVRKPEGA